MLLVGPGNGAVRLETELGHYHDGRVVTVNSGRPGHCRCWSTTGLTGGQGGGGDGQNGDYVHKALWCSIRESTPLVVAGGGGGSHYNQGSDTAKGGVCGLGIACSGGESVIEKQDTCTFNRAIRGIDRGLVVAGSPMDKMATFVIRCTKAGWVGLRCWLGGNSSNGAEHHPIWCRKSLETINARGGFGGGGGGSVGTRVEAGVTKEQLGGYNGGVSPNSGGNSTAGGSEPASSSGGSFHGGISSPTTNHRSLIRQIDQRLGHGYVIIDKL